MSGDIARERRRQGMHVDQPLILDRYRPLEDLASGGFGDVVLAYDTRMQRRVAIKRLPLPHNRTSSTSAPAGLAEARTAALLNHPNIVTVHEWDTDHDEAFIIMEYIEGPTLADVLDGQGALDIDAVAAALEDVSSAIGYAHDNGVLHLDIKPENVLITRGGRAKVTDFGVAALSSATGHGPSHGGTLGYMPMEQLRDEDLDEATDVWALAALIFELLTDANPFASDSIEGAIFRLEIEDIPEASAFAPILSPDIDDVLSAALATHRFDRYGSVSEFVARMAPCLGSAEAGHLTLADIADIFIETGEHADADWDHVGLWDRLASRSGALRRGGAGLAAGWLTWAGLGAFALQPIAIAAATALAVLAAMLAPGLGPVLGVLAFCAGLIATGSWIAALVLGPLSIAVWWFASRRSAAMSGALLTPVLAVGRMALAGPLLLGYEVSFVRTAVLSGYAALLTMLASAATGGRTPYLAVDWKLLVDPLGSRVAAGGIRVLFSNPAPVAVVAAWMVAGAVMSLSCKRASRTAALTGATLGILAMFGGYALADVLALSFNGSATWTGEGLLVHVMASSILMVIVIAAGPPLRAEEE